MTLLAVDIGGTKVQVSRAHAAGDEFEIVASRRVETALLRRGTPVFVDDLVRLLRYDVTRDVDGLALTLNGVLHGPQVVFSSLMGGAVELDLAAHLERELGVPAFVDDDLHAMGIAEGRFGRGRDFGAVCILNIGTGIGAVLYDGDEVVRGRFGAGLISEIPYWVAELDEWRILDRIACGRGLSDMYGGFTGRRMSAEMVFQRFSDGDESARRTVDVFVRALAWVIGTIGRFYHPDAVVLHGSLAKSWRLVENATMSAMRAEMDDIFLPRVVAVSRVQYSAELGVLEQGWGSRGRYA